MKRKKSKGSSGKGSGAGGRRPSRQRTRVQHYSDDNPSTFTKKRRRIDGGSSEESDSESDESMPYQQQKSSNSIAQTEWKSKASSTSATEKKKRRRPASNDNTSNPPKQQEAPPPSPPKNVMMPHTASLAPILPLTATCPHARFSLAQQYPVVFGRGLGIPTPPRAPEWTHMAGYDFYFPGDYKTATVAGTGGTTKTIPVVKSGLWPVCRVVTTIANFQHYTAIGDSAGFVSLYTSGAIGMNALTRLDTSASQREHIRQRREQAKLEQQFKNRPELLKRRSPFWATAKTPNAIINMTWYGRLLVILTPQEVEALYLNFDSKRNCDILWSIPVTCVGGPRKNSTNVLMSGGSLLGCYLELHQHEDMLLWNTWGMAVANQKEDEIKGDSQSAVCDWPLLVLRDTHNTSSAPGFVKIIPFQRKEEEEAPPAPVKRSPGRPPKKKPKPKVPISKEELMWTKESKCHAVTWDKHSNHNQNDRFLMVYSGTSVMSANEAQVLLALMVLTDDTSEDAAEMADSATATATPLYAKLKQQVAIPVTSSVRNVPEVSLQQSPRGTYTLVAGSRGVRMYQTDTLSCLRIYGEHVSLHGKTMVWQSCFVLDNRLQQQLYQQQQEQAQPKKEKAMDSDGHDETDNLGKTVLRQARHGAEEFVWMEQNNTLASLLSKDKSVAPAGTKRRPNSLQRRRASSFIEDGDDDDDDETYWLHQAWIVGVPHAFRGPKELQETLYFWQGEEKLPLFSLPLPHDSGGVQSIHPIVSSSNRRDGVWLRFMVATVNGECLELAPILQTDFPGIMYNPGYAVIQDNLEYIEDEDELDKVIMDVPEEEENDSEEDTPVKPVVGAEVIQDIVDPELAEAIRLSLLEAQENSAAKVKVEKETADVDDEDDNNSSVVVVNDDFGEIEEEEDQLVIPCKPEAFLQKRLLPDIEADTILDDDEGTGSNKSAKDAEFASQVLSILPQARIAQDRWVQQKAMLVPKEVVPREAFQEQPEQLQPPSVNGESSLAPSAGKMARGKRTKAGNLEALLKASIDPELRQYMSDRDRRWADGKGSTLQEDAWEHAIVLAASSSAPAESGVDKAVNRRKESAAKVTEASSTVSARNGPAPAVSASDATGPQENTRGVPSAETEGRSGSADQKNASTEAKSFSMLVSPADAPVDGDSRDHLRAKESSNGDGSTMTSTAGKPGELADKGTPNIVTEEYTPASPEDSSCIQKTEPGQSNNITFDGMQVAIIELKDYSDSAQQYSCTGTVGVPLSLDDCKMASRETSSDKSLDEDGKNKAEQNRMQNLSIEKADETKKERDSVSEKSPLENGKDNTANMALEGQSVKTAEVVRCAACQGRMVIHTCGKRALPIDFEALARAEKERQEKEEEEKRKLKIEKRKQAETKRREAKRKKKEKEEQEKREKEEELRKIRQAELAEARARVSEAGAGLATDLGEPRIGANAVDSVGAVANKLASEVNGHEKPQADPVHFAIADAWKEHASKFSSAEADHNRKGNTQDSSGDALAALASMAEAATQQNERDEPSHQEPSTEVHTSASNHVVSIPHHVNRPDQKRTAHGFFSSADAYPSGAMPANLEARGSFSLAAAQLARRNQIMKSYHAMTAEPSTSKAKIVDLSNETSASHVGHHLAAHSFQIGPTAHPNHYREFSHNTEGYTNFQSQQASHASLGANSQAFSAQSPAPRPYFGYTQISHNFKPKISLGSYASSAIYTAGIPEDAHEEPAPRRPSPSTDIPTGSHASNQHAYTQPPTVTIASLNDSSVPTAAANEAAASQPNWLGHTSRAPRSLNTTWLPQPVHQPGVVREQQTGKTSQSNAQATSDAEYKNP